MSNAILLEDRGVVEVAGADAAKFLHNLVTNDIASLAPGAARYAALLTPQGKIMFDFLVFALEAGGERRFLLDCPLAPELARRLAMYKLRSQITVTDLSAEFDALAYPEADTAPEAETLALARDPRAKGLGFRALANKGAVTTSRVRAKYDARRIAAGVPEGGVDFHYGDAFPHEANMDRLAGVDFKKGCYVGQEVVARMKHRGLARKRVTPFRALGPAPAPGTPVMAGELEIGVTGSRAGETGLAMIRLDRLAEAKAKGARPVAGGVELEFPSAEEATQ
jgi:folate-binding protein YgfZ